MVPKFIIRMGLAASFGAVALLPLASGVARADAIGGPVTPDPALCTAEPRTLENLKSIFAPVKAVDLDERPPALTIPNGPPADAATVDAVTRAVHAAVACMNAGDFLRFFGSMTDNALAKWTWIAELVNSGTIPPELSSPAPLPAEAQQTVLAVSAVSRLQQDGRVGCVLTLVDPASDSVAPDSIYLVLTLVGDRWLIDDFVEFA